jgi:predicted small metal-binding protein
MASFSGACVHGRSSRPLFPSAKVEEGYMPTKILKCGDIMPGCDTVIEGKDTDEVFAKAEAHARKEHNMTIITPNVASQIESAIRDKA